MLEWVCPSCDRLVDPGLTACPFCSDQPPPESPVLTAPARRTFWQRANRPFTLLLRGLGVAAVVYFFVVLWAFLREDDLLLNRLTRWLPMP